MPYTEPLLYTISVKAYSSNITKKFRIVAKFVPLKHKNVSYVIYRHSYDPSLYKVSYYSTADLFPQVKTFMKIR